MVSRRRAFWLLTLWGLILCLGVGVSILSGESGRRLLWASLGRMAAVAVQTAVPDLGCSMEALLPVFAPLPGLRAEGLVLRNSQGDMAYAKSCDLSFDFSALLRGELRLLAVDLNQAALIARVARPGTPDVAVDAKEATASAPPLMTALKGVFAKTPGADDQPAGHSAGHSADQSSSAALPESHEKTAETTAELPAEPPAEPLRQHLVRLAQLARLPWLSPEAEVRLRHSEISLRATAGEWLRVSSLDLELETGATLSELWLRLSGEATLRLPDQTLPLTLNLTLRPAPREDGIQVHVTRLRVDGNEARFEGLLRLPDLEALNAPAAGASLSTAPADTVHSGTASSGTATHAASPATASEGTTSATDVSAHAPSVNATSATSATATSTQATSESTVPATAIPATSASVNATSAPARSANPAPTPTTSASGSPQAPVLRAPELQGHVTVTRLSLGRWFGFARTLPAGLENALDRLSGSGSLKLDLHGLKVSDLNVLVADMPLTGELAVNDFSRPELTITGHTPLARLNTFFRELAPTPSLDLPIYSARPLVPLTPDDATPPALGYDIRLSADNGDGWRWKTGPLSVRISPLPKGAQIDVEAARFYDGGVTARIGVEDNLSLLIDARNVALADPVRQALGFDALQGRLAAKFDVQGRLAPQSAHPLLHFLRSLRGTASLNVDNGSLAQSRESKIRLPFARLHGTFDGQGLSSSSTTELGYGGTWRLGFDSPGKNGPALDVAFTGPLRFSTQSGLPLPVVDLALDGTFKIDGLEGRGKTRLDADRDRAVLTLRDLDTLLTLPSKEGAEGRAGEARLTGTVSLDGTQNPPLWQGRVNLQSGHLRALMAYLGLSVPSSTPGSFQRLDASASFTHSAVQSQLTNLSGKLDNIALGGALSRSASTPPAWTLDLKLGHLDLDRYLSPARPAPEKGRSAPWPVMALRTFTLTGLVQFESLRLYGLLHEKVRLPLRITAGSLTAEPINAILAKGEVNAALRATATDSGALTSLRYSLNSLNLLNLTQELGKDTLVAGTGALNLDLRGLIRSGADLPAALSGSWSAAVREGYIVSRAKAADRAARRNFSLLRGSGQIANGILDNQDLVLTGSSFNAHGKGIINFVNWTINYTLFVSIFRLSEFPVRFTGSLSSPTRDMSAMNAVTGTLDALGLGMVDVLGDIITSPFKIFKP